MEQFIFKRNSAPYVSTCTNGNLDDNESKPSARNRRSYSSTSGTSRKITKLPFPSRTWNNGTKLMKGDKTKET